MSLNWVEFLHYTYYAVYVSILIRWLKVAVKVLRGKGEGRSKLNTHMYMLTVCTIDRGVCMNNCSHGWTKYHLTTAMDVPSGLHVYVIMYM